jgi:hypothetical protein
MRERQSHRKIAIPGKNKKFPASLTRTGEAA